MILTDFSTYKYFKGRCNALIDDNCMLNCKSIHLTVENALEKLKYIVLFCFHFSNSQN